MRNGIFAVVALTMGGMVQADPPSQQPVPQQFVEDLSELRQQVGPSPSTQAEFAQAIRDVAEKRRAAGGMWSDSATEPSGEAWIADGAPQPMPQPTRNPWNAFESQSPRGYVTPVNNPYQAPYSQPVSPPHQGPHPGHHAGPRPPKVLLEDSAFDLERMAHELDKAELYEEADALRDAADRLRQTARRQNQTAPRQGKPADNFPALQELPGPSPDATEHPHAAERARRAVQEANERVRQMERQVSEMEARIERQAAETRRRLQQLQERARGGTKSDERERQEALEGLLRPRERRPDRSGGDRSELPPRGVYGGPTDPPPPPS
ncbi:hypothetical protein [Botrimarina mediterranea]|uniref:hypothetical protein n=1 Tax=Botrimarina mediterranea TaxID=2528022 RepID=UPI0011881735|nr:hypothetical protein K2D_02710 [Planctomycetes bacterium K2D]